MLMPSVTAGYLADRATRQLFVYTLHNCPQEMAVKTLHNYRICSIRRRGYYLFHPADFVHQFCVASIRERVATIQEQCLFPSANLFADIESKVS